MIELFVDGACSGNPGKGGWAFCVVKNNNVVHMESFGLKETTNNICELLAIRKGLAYCAAAFEDEEINVYSDSAYCVNGYNEWLDNWVKNGFLSSRKEPVKNQDHWKDLYKYKTNSKIKIFKIKGHSGHKYNSLVDRMAVDDYKNL